MRRIPQKGELFCRLRETGAGSIYILDFGTQRIQKFRLLPPAGASPNRHARAVIAGAGGALKSSEDGAALKARA